MTRRAWIASICAVGLGIAGATSCVVDSYTPPAESGGAGGTDSQAGPSVTAASGMGGSGGMGGDQASVSTSGPSGPGPGPSSSAASGGGQCSSHLDCVTANPCEKPSCSNGVCANQLINDPTTDVKPSAIGDCAKYVCIGGVLMKAEDTTDVPNDANNCSTDSCLQGVPKHIPSALPCTTGTGNGGTCAALEMGTVFTCIECTTSSTCLSGTDKCMAGKCMPSTCGDGSPNGGETDIDCGGQSCVPCPAGKTCSMPSDCLSKNCVEGKCAAPTCNDDIKNGKESAQDCGNPATTGCNACQPEQACYTAADCITGVCYAGKCSPASCDDNVKNGNEQGIDCGGDCPRPCE